MQMPRVSVIIPVYNCRKYVADAVRSALAQSYCDIEVIVVDDGSSDGSFDIVRNLPGIKCIRKENGGVSSARNLGVLSTAGEYLAFLDADDLWHRHKIEAQVALLDAHQDCALSYCRLCMNEAEFSGEIQPAQIIASGGHVPHLIEEKLESTFVKPYLGTSGVMVRRSIFEQTGGFNVALPYAEDVDFYLRTVVAFPHVALLDFPAVFKRYVPGSLGDDSLAGYEMLFVVYESLLKSKPELLQNNPEMVSKAFADLTRRYAASLLGNRRAREARRAAIASLMHRPSFKAVSVLLSASARPFIGRL